MHSVETKPRPKRNYENHENLEKNLRIEEKKTAFVCQNYDTANCAVSAKCNRL